MSFSRPIQWFHSHADPIWPDGIALSKIRKYSIHLRRMNKKEIIFILLIPM